MKRKTRYNLVIFIIMVAAVTYPFLELTRCILRTIKHPVLFYTPLNIAIPELIYMGLCLIVFLWFLIHLLRRHDED